MQSKSNHCGTRETKWWLVQEARLRAISLVQEARLRGDFARKRASYHESNGIVPAESPR